MAFSGIADVLTEFRQLEQLSEERSALHCLDPRAKLLVTLVFILAVVSCDRYALTLLLPFFLYPLILTIRAGIPAVVIMKKLVLVLPFVLLIGAANPFFDQAPRIVLGTFQISGGWVSLVSLLLRAALTVSAAVLLMATTGFTDLCRALQQLGMPQALVMQLYYMYRYLFVLAEDAAMLSRARQLRSFGNQGMGLKPFASLLGHLLIRSWERAERIHLAMLARGGLKQFPYRRQYGFNHNELFFVCGWVVCFILFRLVNLPCQLGDLVTGLLQISGKSI